MRNRISRKLLGALLVAVSLFASANLLAHVHLVSATPAANSHVASAETVELVFSEALTPRVSRATLSRVEGGTATEVEAQVELVNDNTTVRITPAAPLAAGDYKVEWRVVGKDNHPMSGHHGFMIH